MAKVSHHLVPQSIQIQIRSLSGNPLKGQRTLDKSLPFQELQFFYF